MEPDNESSGPASPKTPTYVLTWAATDLVHSKTNPPFQKKVLEGQKGEIGTFRVVFGVGFVDIINTR